MPLPRETFSSYSKRMGMSSKKKKLANKSANVITSLSSPPSISSESESAARFAACLRPAATMKRILASHLYLFYDFTHRAVSWVCPKFHFLLSSNPLIPYHHVITAFLPPSVCFASSSGFARFPIVNAKVIVY
jgi:hypothetical protein